MPFFISRKHDRRLMNPISEMSTFGTQMFLSHGGRPTKSNRKRKGVDEYAAENRPDFEPRSIIRDGHLVRILVCRFCSQSIGARSDRIKEHLSSKRHRKLKIDAFKLFAAQGRDLSLELSAASGTSGALPQPNSTSTPKKKARKRTPKKIGSTNVEPLSDLEGGQRALDSNTKAPDSTLAQPSAQLIHSPLETLNQDPEHEIASDEFQHPDQESSQSSDYIPVEASSLRDSSGVPRSPIIHNTGTISDAPTSSLQMPQSNSSPKEKMFTVRWGNYDFNMVTMFSKLRASDHFVDVTICTEEGSLKCHKIVLSACSTYFEKVLTQMPQHMYPIIFLKDIKMWEMEALVEFMYEGEVSIPIEKLQPLMEAAKSLHIKGLGYTSKDTGNNDNISGSHKDNEQIVQQI